MSLHLRTHQDNDLETVVQIWHDTKVDLFDQHFVHVENWGQGIRTSLLFFLTYYPGGKILSNMRRRDDSDDGSAIGFRLVIGVGIGVAIGVALDSIPVGIAVGAGLGFLLGAVIDQRRR